mgnify:CR=1 FL=1
MAIDPRIPMMGITPDIPGAMSQGILSGERLAQAPIRNQMLQQQVDMQGQQMQLAPLQLEAARQTLALNKGTLGDAENARKQQAGAFMYNSAQALKELPLANRAAAFEGFNNTMKGLGYSEALGLGELGGDLSDSSLDSIVAAFKPYSGMGEEKSVSQQDFEYWQALPPGSDASNAFGQQKGFITSEKDSLSITKLQKEIQSLENNGGLSATDKMDMEGKLRSEVLARGKEFEKVDDAYSRIKASAVNPSPAGDLALIFNYMKVLDPGSTVREGEFANAQNAGGIDEKTVGLYNNIVNGKRLSESQRQDFVDRGGRLYEASQTKNNSLQVRYKGLSERYGLNAGNVILNENVTAKHPQTGEVLRLVNGKWVPQ